MAFPNNTDLHDTQEPRTRRSPRDRNPSEALDSPRESTAKNGAQTKKSRKADSKQNKASGLLCRLFWISFGNLGPLVSAVYIMKNTEGFFSIADIIYAVFVLLLIVVRYVDIKYLDGETDEGEPATMQHFTKYVPLMLAIYVPLWVIAHFIKI